MRHHLLLALWSVLIAILGVTVVVADGLDRGGAGSDQIIGGPDGTVGSTTTSPLVVVPRPGQVHVSGTVTALRLDGAVLDPRTLSTPLIITASRGFGNGAELTDVTVDGQQSTIVWDGGRPFVLSGRGAIVPAPLRLDLVPSGLRLTLGGGTHGLVPGTYRLDTPVAVGTSGVATPRDIVVFDASTESLLDVRGDAAVVLGAGPPLHLLGPGRVELSGTLELTDATGAHEATSYSVEVAAFDLTLSADPGGEWRVVGLIDTNGAA